MQTLRIEVDVCLAHINLRRAILWVQPLPPRSALKKESYGQMRITSQARILPAIGTGSYAHPAIPCFQSRVYRCRSLCRDRLGFAIDNQ
jgi:hypothetical protein